MPRRLRREAAGLSRLLEDVGDFDAIGVFFSVQNATSLIEPRRQRDHRVSLLLICAGSVTLASSAGGLLLSYARPLHITQHSFGFIVENASAKSRLKRNR